MNTTNPQLPAYVCTKQFQAAKIVVITKPTPDNPKMHGLLLESEGGGTSLQLVHEGYIKRNWPQVGGYFLRTSAGHARYLSAEEFEQDYARVPNPQPVSMADIELLAGQEWKAPGSAQNDRRAQFDALMKLAQELPPLLDLQLTEQELAEMRARGSVQPLKFNRIRKDDPFAFMPAQADVIRLMPADSESLHAAPHYSDMLPHKQGGGK